MYVPNLHPHGAAKGVCFSPPCFCADPVPLPTRTLLQSRGDNFVGLRLTAQMWTAVSRNAIVRLQIFIPLPACVGPAAELWRTTSAGDRAYACA